MHRTVIIDQEWLSKSGTGTLIAEILPQGQETPATHLCLKFKQTSLGWRREHGGPEAWIMNEFAIPCLIEDILRIQEMGIKVTVES